MESSSDLGNCLPVLEADRITLQQVNHLFPMKTALDADGEIRQVEECARHKFPKLWIEALRDDVLCLVGYGPSLKDTWKQITHPCMTVSGAHDFLMERGLTPDYHVECDGRAHKTKHLEKPNKVTEYLMASVCHPKMWEQLEGCRVKTWHNTLGQHMVDWIGRNDPNSIMVAGGSVVGMSAIHIAGILGFRRFRLFGFDNNLSDGERHAGPHYGPPQRLLKRRVKDRWWYTTPQMTNAADELGWLMENHPELEIEIVGESMTKALHGA